MCKQIEELKRGYSETINTAVIAASGFGGGQETYNSIMSGFRKHLTDTLGEINIITGNKFMQEQEKSSLEAVQVKANERTQTLDYLAKELFNKDNYKLCSPEEQSFTTKVIQYYDNNIFRIIKNLDKNIKPKIPPSLRPEVTHTANTIDL